MNGFIDEKKLLGHWKNGLRLHGQIYGWVKNGSGWKMDREMEMLVFIVKK